MYVISAFLCRHKTDHQVALAALPKWDSNSKRGIETQFEFDEDVKKLQEHMFHLDPALKKGFGL